MTTHYLNPAYTIIQAFATPSEKGEDVIAEIIGRHPSTVWHWQRPKDSGGTNGLIPAKHMDKLAAGARKLKLRQAVKLLNEYRETRLHE